MGKTILSYFAPLPLVVFLCLFQGISVSAGRGMVGDPAPARGEAVLLARADTAAQADLLFWETIKGSSDPAMFQAYLRKFPDGIFAELARLKLEAFGAAEPAPPAPTSAPPVPAGAPAPQPKAAHTPPGPSRQAGSPAEMPPARPAGSEPQALRKAAKGKAILILDASGSMRAHMKGRAKMSIAKEVLRDVIEGFDPAMEIGLMAYGHRRKDDCTDIQELMPAAQVDRQALLSRVDSLRAVGKTPLTESVRQAAATLDYEDAPATVILISDGRENCGADPCAVARELERAGAEFTVHVIGFDLKKEERAALQCIADNTGGRYYAAADADALEAALRETVEQADIAFQKGSNFFATLGDSAATLHLAIDWRFSEATGEADSPRAPVLTEMSQSRVLGPKLPNGRYVVDIAYANATGRKVVDFDTDAPENHTVPLNAGEMTVWVIREQGGAKYSGPPYPKWEVTTTGGNDVVHSDIRDGTTMILAPGLYDIGVAVDGLAVTVPAEIVAGRSVRMPVVVASGRLLATALKTRDGAPYDGTPYAEWRVQPVAADGSVGPEIARDIGNRSDFVLAPGKYRLSARAGVLRGHKDVGIVADKTVEASVLLQSGRVYLRSYYAEGGGQHTSSPYNQWSLHPVDSEGSGEDEAIDTDIAVVGDMVVPPGEYIARVEAGAMQGRARVVVEAGQTLEVAVDLQAAPVTIGWQDRSVSQWKVYPVAADGAPGSRYVAYSYRNAETVHLPAGRYLVRGKGDGFESEGTIDVVAGRPMKVIFRSQ